MFNEFLTQTLQVILVLDVVGVVAYFVMSARKRAHKPVFSGDFRSEPVAAHVSGHGSLWHKLVPPHRASPALCPNQTLSAIQRPTLESSLGQLRRVLDSYRTSLA